MTNLILLIVLLAGSGIVVCLAQRNCRKFTFHKLKYIKKSRNAVECITYEGESPSGELVIPGYVKENKKLKVTSIGRSAFLYCGHITSLEIEEGVTAIGSYAFQNCINLTSVILPSTLTTIGSYAFANCTGLQTIISRNTEYPHLGLHTFSNVKTAECTLFVPSSADITSQATGKWSIFTNIQREEKKST